MTVAATNVYCEQLGIAVPSLDSVRAHPDANTYALLIVALLEHGQPMTLDDVAVRFEAAGVVSHVDDAYASLKRCRPARPPVYRDGDFYALDPYDAELDLWAFRLGLRPPRVPRREPPPARPRPASQERLSVPELDDAWRDASLHNWSAQRIALAVLDAHGHPMSAEDVVAFVSSRTKWHRLVAGPTPFKRTGSAVAVDAAGTWSIVPGAPELVMARDAVRDAVERARKWPVRSTPEQIQASTRAAEQRRAAHAAELVALRRVIVHAFPPKVPAVAVLVDVEAGELTTWTGAELGKLPSLLEPFDVLCGVDVRATLRALGVDPGERRFAELGPPQKSVRLNRSGRTLKITTAMLIQGSCGFRRPLGDDKKLRGYLANGDRNKLHARLEADAKAIYALHQYGRVHGCVRLRWGFLDELFPAPWHHRDEPTLYHLKREAHAMSMGIVAVVGSAPGWADPWARARRLNVVRGPSEYDLALFDELGSYVDDRDVQLARLEAVVN